MLSTAVLLDRFIEEGRADKAASLSDFIDIVEDREGEDLYPVGPQEDEDVLRIANAWHVPADYSWN